MLGWFRDIEDPDAFVWLRGFADMEARARALQAFYRGAVWHEHREAANATMVDFDNVLLLGAAGELSLRPSGVPATGCRPPPRRAAGA